MVTCRVAKMEDIKELCRLLHQLFLQEAEFLPDEMLQDIGSFLMNFALKCIKIKGCMRVTLLSDSNNFKAHKFYEKHGFVKSAMIPFRKVIDVSKT